MKSIKATLFAESTAEQSKAGRYNPATKFRFENYEGTLKCGTSDHVAMFREGAFVFALSTNESLDYAGLERFQLQGDDDLAFFPTSYYWARLDDVFLDSGLPKNFFDWSDRKQVNYLAEYLH